MPLHPSIAKRLNMDGFIYRTTLHNINSFAELLAPDDAIYDQITNKIRSLKGDENREQVVSELFAIVANFMKEYSYAQSL